MKISDYINDQPSGSAQNAGPQAIVCLPCSVDTHLITHTSGRLIMWNLLKIKWGGSYQCVSLGIWLLNLWCLICIYGFCVYFLCDLSFSNLLFSLLSNTPHSLAVASMVKQALQDSLVQILQPKRRVDILRDVLEAQAQHKPFVITFCGVNGVGKSTNLAKVRILWLLCLWEIIVHLMNRLYTALEWYTHISHNIKPTSLILSRSPLCCQNN